MNLLIPQDRNLVVYYVLPLTQVNIVTFGRKFKNAYLNKTGTQVHVEVSSPLMTPNYELSPHYTSTLNIGGSTIVNFRIPNEFLPDIQLFMKGLYSQMSKSAKKIIYATSGLPYNETMEDFSITHPVLHALGSTKRLKEFLTGHLGVVELADSGELIDPPDETWYIEDRVAALQLQ